MKKRFGDRRDGTLIRNTDSMHIIMPLIYPNRCDNEAYMSIIVDLTNIDKFINEKNSSKPEYEYKLFQIMVATMLKVLVLRPKMNRFIANSNLYQRNCFTASFTMKKDFDDDGDEVLVRVNAEEKDNLETVREQMYAQIRAARVDNEKDKSTESMDILQKLPRPLLKVIAAVARSLDRHGWMPESAVSTDPFQASVILSNIGSLKIQGAYHHLTNWGTTSIMCMVGEIKERSFRINGNTEYRRSVELGITIDERIADGYYYSKTLRLIRYLMENPEILEQPFCESCTGKYYYN